MIFDNFMQCLLKKLGIIIQFYVILSIHIAVLFEITWIDEYLLSISPYEREFNHITGWPLYFLTLFFYYKACTMPPGKVRKNWDLYQRGDKYGAHTCVQCHETKPLRTSHCKRCRTCVSRRDHHCFFTNSCVGYYNFKAFMWFLVFGLLGTLHFEVRGVQWLVEWYWGTQLQQYSNTCALLLLVHVYNMCGFLGLLAHIFQKTLRNAIRNVSTLDSWMNNSFCGNSELNFYNLGLVQNMAIAFGENPLLWISAWPPSRFGLPLGPEFPIQPQ